MVAPNNAHSACVGKRPAGQGGAGIDGGAGYGEAVGCIALSNLTNEYYHRSVCAPKSGFASAARDVAGTVQCNMNTGIGREINNAGGT